MITMPLLEIFMKFLDSSNSVITNFINVTFFYFEIPSFLQ